MPLFELNLEQQYDKIFLQVGQRLQHTTENKNAKDLMQVAERLHRIHFEVHNKTLVQNTFINMLRIFEDPRVTG
jgi:DNA anti-recombination protein RmuC